MDAEGKVVFNEKMSMMCTMYRTSNGKFQEKETKLALKVKKQTKSLANNKFNLAEFISGPTFTSGDIAIDLTKDGGMFSKEKKGGMLYIRISSRFIPPEEGGDNFTEMTGAEAMQPKAADPAPAKETAKPANAQEAAQAAKKKLGALEPRKYEFDIEVIDCKGLETLAGEAVIVSWTTGAHISSTKPVTVDGGAAGIQEKLSMRSTVYESASGKFKDKSSKLALKVKSKGTKAVGSLKFDLSQYIQGISNISDVLTLELKPEAGSQVNAQLTVTIGAKFIPPEEGGDEFTEMTVAPGAMMAAAPSVARPPPNGGDFSDDDEEDAAPQKLGKMVTAASPARTSRVSRNPVKTAVQSDAKLRLQGLAPRRQLGGLAPQKFEFTVEIVKGKDLIATTAGEQLIVSWTSGAHVESTQPRLVEQPALVEVGETLTMRTTVYQSTSGKFQEKRSQLALKIKSKGRALATHKFNLSQFIRGPSFTSDPFTIVLQTPKEATAGEIICKIGSRFIPPEEGGDEFTEMSMMPGAPGAPAPAAAADFSDDDEDDGKPRMGKMVSAPPIFQEPSGPFDPSAPALTREEQRARLAEKAKLLKERFADEQKRASELNQKLEDAGAALTNAEADKNSLMGSEEQQKARLEELHTALKANQEQHQQESKAAQESMAALEATVSELTEALRLKEAEAKQQGETLTQRVEALEKSLKDEQKRTLDMQEAAAGNQSKLVNELNEMTAKANEQELCLQVAEEEKQQQQQVIEQLEDELSEANADLEVATEEQQRLVDEVLTLEESLAIEQNHAEKLEHELNSLFDS